MTIYIGFQSKVAGVTIVGVYPLGFNGVGTGNGRDPLASVSTSLNPSGYTPTIVTPATFDGKPMYIVIDEDDIFRYNAENKVCMLLNKDTE